MNRPALERLFADIEADKVDMIVVYIQSLSVKQTV